MKISYNWLKTYIDIDVPVDELADLLTDIGLEVEGIDSYESVKGGLDGIVVGKVLSVSPHPDADKLRVTTVDVGSESPLQIVCGAPNVEEGQTVPIALVGTTLYSSDDSSFKIKKAKLRGVESIGMICAEDEIGLGTSHDGIMVLEDHLEAGRPLSEVFDVHTDTIFEIGLTPNRADAFHHIGVARDLRAAINYREGKNLEIQWPDNSAFMPGKGQPINVEVTNADACPRYAGLVMEGLSVGPSPEWLQNRLLSIGQRPINNVVDVTNFVMHEYGQPLHAFDLSVVNNSVRVGNLPEGTKFTTLDEEERQLSGEDLMICNGAGGMCIAGVFGGAKSGVKNTTTSIFLESAYFDARTIRRTSTRHGLRTDAASHFEKGIDPHITLQALKRAALLLAEIAGGSVVSDIADIQATNFSPFSVSMETKQLDRIAGIAIPKEDIERIFHLLEIDVESVANGVWSLKVPQYRVDVQREADIIEEVLRIYGFNSIPIPEKLNANVQVATTQEKASELFEKVASFLVGNGFYEIMVNSITKEKYNTDDEQVRLLNNLNAELTVMRQSMLSTGLEAVRHNLNHKNLDCKFFELGKEYSLNGDDFNERDILSLWVTGSIHSGNWRSKDERSDFFYVKTLAERIVQILGIGKYATSPSDDADLREGLQWKVGKKTLVDFGEVKQSVLEKVDIDNPVFYVRIYWDVMTALALSNEVRFKELPKYPSIKRDLALLVDEQSNYASFEKIAKIHGKGILKEIDLFDVYQDKKMQEGKKSYAISFIFRDEHKTLNDKEVDKIMKQLMYAYKNELNAEIR